MNNVLMTHVRLSILSVAETSQFDSFKARNDFVLEKQKKYFRFSFSYPCNFLFWVQPKDRQSLHLGQWLIASQIKT